MLSALRAEADGILYKFGNEFADALLPDMTLAAFNQRTREEIAEFRRDAKGLREFVGVRTGYTHHLKTHVIGFLAIAGLIGLVTLAANFDNAPRDIVNGIGRLLSGRAP